MGGLTRHRHRLRAIAFATAVAAWARPVSPSAGDLSAQLQAIQGKADALSTSISKDNAVIGRFQGRIADQLQRLRGLQTSLAIQEAILDSDKRRLRASRAHLLRLKVALATDMRVLA